MQESTEPVNPPASMRKEVVGILVVAMAMAMSASVFLLLIDL